MIREVIRFTALSAIAICSSAYGEIRFEKLESESGIELVNDLYRDRDGYLWVSTYFQGLAKFNGYSTKWYRVDKDDKNSISSNAVIDITEDKNDILWVATRDGLERLDRDRDIFTRYRHETDNPQSLADNTVWSVFKDQATENLWTLTSTAVHRYVPESDNFIRYAPEADAADPYTFRYITEDLNGMMWIVSTKGGIHRFDPGSGKFKFFPHPQFSKFQTGTKRLSADPNGKYIWMAVSHIGLLRFDIEAKTFHHYPIDPEHSGKGIPSNACRDLTHLDDNTLAVAVDQGGICLLDKKTDQFSYVNKKDAPGSRLTTNGIARIYKDDEGIVWVGTTRGGVFYNNLSHYSFETYTSSGQPGLSLSEGIVGTVFEDSRGLVWIGTDGGGVNILDRGKNEISVLSTTNSSLSSNVIRSFAEDSDGNVLISTWNAGLHRYIRSSGDLEFIEYPPKLKELLSGRGLWSLQVDASNRIWICTNYYTILLDDELNYIKHFTAKSTVSSRLGRIYQFEDGSIYASNNEGIFIFDEETQGMNSFVEGLQIVHMARDKKGLCYIATSDLGLFVYDSSGTQIKTLTVEDGLANNTLRSIQLSNDETLWVGTDNGLSCVNLDDYSISNYYESDGLQGNSYFLQSSITLRDGSLAFGGTKGLSIWQSNDIISKPFNPSVHIDGMRVFNEFVDMQDFLVEDKNSAPSRHLEVNWNSKMIGFDFSAVGFTYPEKIQYAYMLKGFDEDWIHTDSQNRKATYTNLSPGNYELIVRASDFNGNWSTNEAQLKIHVIAPFWMTKWFYGLVALSVLFLIYFYQRRREHQLQKEQARLKQQVEERSELINEITKAKDRAENLGRLKSQFLANMSHEIRTPMNAIIGFSQLLSDSDFSEEEKKSFVNQITLGTESLLRLIEDILDISMIEANQLKVEISDFSLMNLLEEVYSSLLVYSRSENVKFEYRNPYRYSKMVVNSDYFRMRQIVSNLVSNALKFTADGSVELGLRETENELIVYISDTGDGMEEEELDMIFSQFVKLERHNVQAMRGVGLGLSISKRLADLLNCSLEVSSTKGTGTEFRLMIPKSMTAGELAVGEIETKPIANYDWQAYSILVVEDEESNFEYLKQALKKTQIKIDWAKNGRNALSQIEDRTYDLILMDIKMPEMDGYQAVKKIKEIQPSLKVIAQTAHAMSEDQAKLRAGGFDDYLSKPIMRANLYAAIAKFIQ